MFLESFENHAEQANWDGKLTVQKPFNFETSKRMRLQQMEDVNDENQQ